MSRCDSEVIANLGAGLGALCRCLPKKLAAATRLTWLVLIDPGPTPLDVAADALPRSLQRLQLNDYYIPNDDEIPLRKVTRDFGSMDRLQSLQLGAFSVAEYRLPLR